MPSSLHAQMTRKAISPRFATRIFLNMICLRRPAWDDLSGGLIELTSVEQCPSFCRADSEQFLAVFDGLTVGNEFLDQLSGHIAFNFVHQFHRFDNAQYLAHIQRIAYFDKWWRTRRRGFVKSAHDRRLHNV